MNQSQITALAAMVQRDEEASAPIDPYIEIEAKPYAELPANKRNAMARRISGIVAAKNKVRRNMVHDRLSSWGEWRVKSNIKTPTKTYNPDDEVMAEGFDHALLTDFDSAMIVIDTAIGKLNKIDRIMLELEYSRECKDPLKQWNNEMMASRSQSTYDNRLRALQLDPRIIKACGY